MPWTFGTLLVGVSVGQSAIIAHKLGRLSGGDPERELRLKTSLENARLITMLNGLGLAMSALKKTTRPAPVFLLPCSLLMTGTTLFSGIIFYEAFTRDASHHWLIKFGGAASIFGWITMGRL